MLTQKQKELLLFIHGRLQEQGVPPSFDEMKEALDHKSKSGIHRLITALEVKSVMTLGPALKELRGGLVKKVTITVTKVEGAIEIKVARKGRAKLTDREEAILGAITGVLGNAAPVALVVTLITALLLAQWLARPLRRLTRTSRLLAEGHLEARVQVPASSPPEVQELANAFNALLASAKPPSCGWRAVHRAGAG